MPPLIFAEWAPDQPDLGTTTRDARGLIPDGISYRPFKSLATVSNALGARAQGAAWFRTPDGETFNFAGDATKLYILDGSSWTNATRITDNYETDASGNWRFEQYVDTAYATNGVDVLQSFDLTGNTSTKWEDAAGEPPVAKYIGVAHNNFLVLAGLALEPTKVAWSGDNNITAWTSSAVTGADEQALSNGGEITGFFGGVSSIVYQESALREMVYEGSPTVFRFDKIASDLGNSVPNSVAGWGSLSFFCHRSGFHLMVGTKEIKPIGRDRVDRWFWDRIDQSNMFRCSSCIDPVNSLYMLAFPTEADGVLREILIYNYKADRWSHVPMTCELIYSGATQRSWTLEDLNDFTTIEAVPYSLDSSYWTGVRQLLLAGFDTNHKYGTFSGANAAGRITTQEYQPIAGRRARILAARPLVDGGSPKIAVGTRATQQGDVNWTAAGDMTADGRVPLRAEGRYARFRVTIPAGSEFGHAIGVDDIDARPAGKR